MSWLDRFKTKKKKPKSRAVPVTSKGNVKYIWWWCHQDYWLDDEVDKEKIPPLFARGQIMLLPDGEMPEGEGAHWVQYRKDEFNPSLDARVK